MMKVTLLLLLVAVITVRALNNGMGLLPPLGWTTWCSEGQCGKDYCTEGEVKEAAQAMLTNGLFDMGYRWVLLDDCWAHDARLPNGSLTWSPARFPSGIPALTHWLHQRNLSFGLYTSAGNATCDKGGRPRSIPGSEGHYQLDMNTFATWNVDYVKVDWCGDVHSMPLDGIKVGRKDYVAVSNALTNATPARPMYLEGVGAMLFLLWDVEQYVNAWRANSDHHDSWKNTMEVFTTNQLVHFKSVPGAWSYMDVLMTGGQGCRNPTDAANWTAHCPGMTDDEYITEFSIWNVMQSPLLVSTDIRNMTSIMTRILLNKRWYDIHQNTATPAGQYLGADKSCAGYGIFAGVVCQMWARRLHDGSVLVVFLNAAEDTTSPATAITLDFALWSNKLPAGWGANTTVVVEDLWDASRSGAVSVGKFTSAAIAPHAVNAVVLHPQSKQE